MRILLTGASGFIGRATLRRLLKNGHNVLAPLRNPAAVATHPNLEVLRCDLTALDTENTQYIQSFRPETVIHCAWLGTENTNRDTPEYCLPNLLVIQKLFYAALEAGCKRWVALGSQAEYAPEAQSPIRENASCDTDSAYGTAKLAACGLLQTLGAQHDVQTVWLRLFASYGPEYKASYVIPYILQCFAQDRLPELRTPHAVWDYIHVEDVAAALEACALSRAEGVFNLGTGNGASVGDIALMLAELWGFEQQAVLQEHIQQRSDAVIYRVADMTRLFQTLSWRPGFSLAQGLRSCITPYKEA